MNATKAKPIPGMVPVYNQLRWQGRRLVTRVTWARAFDLVLTEKARPIKFDDLYAGITILEPIHGKTTKH